jgi:hypothetical protein
MQRILGLGLSALLMCVSAAMFTDLASAQSSPVPSAIPPVTTPTLVATPTPDEQAAQHRATVLQARQLRQSVKHYRERACYWRFIMQSPCWKKPSFGRVSDSLSYLKWMRDVWKKRASSTRKLALHPSHSRLWLCIHRQEGSWTDNASNNPHWGGLQMGEWFMRHYAPRLRAKLGRANKWPPLMQVWVAENAFKREHYSRVWLLGQWVPTASRCI